MTDVPEIVDDLDPLGYLDAGDTQTATKNRAKVGSARPSSLLYTYGPGSTVDLPAFTVMPGGLDSWDRIWARRSTIPTVHAPRLLEAVRTHLGPQVAELRPFPWAPKANARSKEGDDLGIPARVFPQWLRCTGCDMLGPLTKFTYTNTNPFRPDKARFEHERCPGHRGKVSAKPVPAVPARYLIACTDGHLDEFPYSWWVHQGDSCSAADVPALAMPERSVGKGASATIVCKSCGASRPMNEAQGEIGRSKLPRCRGRHPHLGLFVRGGCAVDTQLMILGASNLWFPATLSIVVMPEAAEETAQSLADELRVAVKTEKRLERLGTSVDAWRDFLEEENSPLARRTDAALAAALAVLTKPAPTEEQIAEQRRDFDPVSLLVPERQFLQRDPLGKQHQADEKSGLVLSPPDGGVHPNLAARHVSRVLAVDKLRKVNAVLGFTRIDEMERANDIARRLAPLNRDGKPRWAVASEDRGEGVFLQFDETAVAAWEARVESEPLWEAHRSAHERNFRARFSETAKDVDPDTRFRPARYWLLHTLAHVMIREMAMRSGYSAASLAERIYAWKADGERSASAGILIVTTASDSDGTLGGLVQLSERGRLNNVIERALTRARRCSSDPLCAHRTPKEPEDFLHGAACHTCAMASETSCERANRFLDRRFLVDLPGAVGLGFFH